MDWVLKRFSELTLEELYQNLQLRTDVFVVEQECFYPEVDGRDQASYHLFAKDGEETVAYLRILPPGLSFEEASIGRVVVKETHRGQGLARLMLERAITFILEEWGQQQIKISAQTYLQEFYTSLGFVPVSKMYLEDGIPHLDMIYTKNEA